MIEWVGSQTLYLLNEFFAFLKVFFDSCVELLKQIFFFRLRMREVVNQCFEVAYQSLPIVVVCLTFLSLMMILEFSFHMKMVIRQDSLVPAFSTLLMVRGLGPVVTCLLLASRVGAAMTAEIGSMRVTEQIDALKMLNISPISYLCVPRWIATVFACVSLTILALGLSILGGSVMGAMKLNYPLGQFFNTMFVFTHYEDIIRSLIKAAVFGTLIPMIACFYGFRCKPGAEGVGEATTSSVVQSTLAIIGADFLLTYLFYTG